MPRGIYAREQQVDGYRDKAYWSRKLKERANSICEKCGARRPTRLLTVMQIGERLTLDSGQVLCFRCDAERHFESVIWSVPELLVKAHESGIFLSEHHLRQWARLDLLPRPYRGFLPDSLLPRVALLYHNRQLPGEVLRELISRQEVKTIVLENLVTGEPEVLVVIEEFPGVSLDGKSYHCRRLLDGALLIRSDISTTKRR